jgi:hypothetical protein
VIAEQDKLLTAAAKAHKNMKSEVAEKQAAFEEAMERKEQCNQNMKVKLALAEDAAEQKRVTGASVSKIANELHRIFTGLNDVLNKNSFIRTRQEDGPAAQTPLEIISVAKATLLNELSMTEPKLREDISGAWSELVNSCVSKAHNIDRRCVERGVAAVCFLFHKKADPTYTIPVGGFGTTPEHVAQRFLEMIGSEQSTWAHIQHTIEDALQHINPPPA